ncbi:hypothetical protein QJS10_CPB04g00271 [Acorus calamus]|uniref:ELMO domain-containing protein n=1 Tax=Acorus calamus TaxID=4465 RepID=A0AAV9F088_ACOCL|nr:hypothetical protein QJS10_CPB04g00271 [Acorus calamus]
MQASLSSSSSTSSSSLSRCSQASAAYSDDLCGTPAWIGKGLSCEQRVQRLKHRMKVYFDASRQDHQEALRALWYATYPDQELHGLISDQWKEMGWQGKDPSTDFRGGGFISLENLLFFAKTFTML